MVLAEVLYYRTRNEDEVEWKARVSWTDDEGRPRVQYVGPASLYTVQLRVSEVIAPTPPRTAEEEDECPF